VGAPGPRPESAGGRDEIRPGLRRRVNGVRGELGVIPQ
jgi:hypothetical protein